MIVFSSQHFEENQFREEDLVRLTPFGISLNIDPTRPTLLLKDESGQHTLPVALNPLEAGVTLSQSNPSLAATTPHKVMQLLLESLNIKLERVVFVEIKGHHQFVRLYFDGHPTHGSLKVKADEAMSLSLHLKVPIFATKKLMEKSRFLNAELDVLAKAAVGNRAAFGRSSEYLM